MKKTKVISIANHGKFNHLMIEKQSNFFDFINSLFVVADETVEIYKYEGEEKRNIFNLIDKHEGFRSDDITIDIFYGKDRIFSLS